MPYDTLVLSAGGTYAVAYIGALRCLEDHRVAHKLRHFYGTSAGALVCSMAACGLTSAEMLAAMEAWGARAPRPTPRDFMRIPRAWGALDAEAAVGALVDAYLPPEETFATLAKRRGNVLTTYAFNVHTGQLDAFSIERTPDVSVRKAVCASCCIPFLFEPVDIGGVRYVDGGVSQRTPTHDVRCGATALVLDVVREAQAPPRNVWEYFACLASGASRHPGGVVTINVPASTPTILDTPLDAAAFEQVERRGFDAVERLLGGQQQP